MTTDSISVDVNSSTAIWKLQKIIILENKCKHFLIYANENFGEPNVDFITNYAVSNSISVGVWILIPHIRCSVGFTDTFP